MVFFRLKTDIPLGAWDTLRWDERVVIFKTAGVLTFLNALSLTGFKQVVTTCDTSYQDLPDLSIFDIFGSYFHWLPYVGGCKVQET